MKLFIRRYFKHAVVNNKRFVLSMDGITIIRPIYDVKLFNMTY